MEYWNFRFMILDLRLTPSSSPLERGRMRSIVTLSGEVFYFQFSII